MSSFSDVYHTELWLQSSLIHRSCMLLSSPSPSVPHLPFDTWGFHHEPTEVYYNLRQDDYRVCDSSGEDPACADQHVIDLDILDHVTYLGFPFAVNYLGCALGSGQKSLRALSNIVYHEG